jgi:PAS domain S-box-containing protein
MMVLSNNNRRASEAAVTSDGLSTETSENNDLPEAKKLPQKSGEPFHLEQLIERWLKQLNYFWSLLIWSFIFLVCSFILFALFPKLSTLVPIAILGSLFFGFVLFKGASIRRNVLASWNEDLFGPTQRLMRTIEMIESQKLELLPEERRLSYTSPSQQKLLELARGILEHQRFVDQVVDNMFEMMFLLNPDGVILKANKSAFENTSYQPSELVGQHIRKIFPHGESLVDYYLELEIQFTTAGDVRDMEIHIQTSDGEILPFSINGVKIESSSGDLLGYTLIAKNMAETFRLINELNKSNYELNRANSELAKRYDQIKLEIEEKEGERKVLELELATSQLVQKTFLPQKPPEHAYVNISGTAVPAAFCGGDWWNTIPMDDKFYVFIGDVTGHGTASAMVTAAVSGYYVALKEALLSGRILDVDEILMGFDSVLSTMANEEVSYYMTCFACVLDFKKRVIRFANAGHNFPLLVRANSKLEPLVASGHRLGNSQKEPFMKFETPMAGGEFLFFYTDGLIENKNELDEQFGKRRLRKFIENHHQRPPGEFVEKLCDESLGFYGTGKALEDDVTFIALKIKDLLHT